MGKKEDQQHQHPYMYIVQPEIEAPDANMQSHYKSKVSSSEEGEVVAIDDASAEDEKPAAEEEVRVVRVISAKEQEEQSEEDQMVEMSTGVDSELADDHSQQRKLSKNARIAKKKKKQRFSQMSKEDLLDYLAKMPSAVPRPVCHITIDREHLVGQVLRKRDQLYMIKLLIGDREKTIAARLEDIDEIEVGNL
ncbi:CotO family spore coat protein [Bacillus testis]|uniref:CotO family spore coat protein n=1 Tax=Bacillus testis TaxID=1622072 RepID=UPI00067F2A79|nr:CotO family spore coat protein [Bacillus testis]